MRVVSNTLGGGCPDCTQSQIAAARVSNTSDAAKTTGTNRVVCTPVGTGDEALAFWGFDIRPGPVIGILLAFYVVLHFSSYFALSKLFKQKR